MSFTTIKANVRDATEAFAPAYLLRAYYFRRMHRELRETTIRGRRFEAELALLPALLTRSEGCAIDVGANLGDYTFLLQRLLGPAQTYAVEPQAALYRRLRRLFPNVNVFRLAMSDRQGDLELKIPKVNGMPLTSRATLEQFSEIGETGAMFETVPVETLDRLSENAKLRDLRFIKVDVEGHENRVVAGAERLLATWRPILQVEIEQRHHSRPIDEVFHSVAARDYAGFYFDPVEQRLRSIDQFSVSEQQDVTQLGKPGYIQNFLFFGRSAAGHMVDTVHRHLAHRQK